jgi:radical SAM-linked protein
LIGRRPSAIDPSPEETRIASLLVTGRLLFADCRGGHPGMVRDKVRIRFRKAGDLRLISHHDLLRCFERMLRRSALPFRSTAGFNPRPRLVFALSLPLGIVGCEEVAELELEEEIPPVEVQCRLAEQCPAGLEIIRVVRIDPRGTAQVRRVTYRLPLPPDCGSGLPERIADCLSASECWIERTRPTFRRLDIRPYLCGIRLSSDALEMDLSVTPHGTARPEEVLEHLGLQVLLEQGAVFERTRLELQDESEYSLPAAPSLTLADTDQMTQNH